MHHDLQLKVDGLLYGGWQSINVIRSMECVAGSFSLSVTDRWSGQKMRRPIQPGAACQILIDGSPVITGYVDDVDINYDSESHGITVRGRDNTGDLVDCSVELLQLSNFSLIDGLRRLAKPYGINVDFGSGVSIKDRFPQARTNPGNTVFSEMDKAAKVAGVLLINDGAGNLLITRASKERIPATLQLGNNILSCDATFTLKDRYHKITVVADRSTLDGADFEHLVGVAIDNAIRASRSLDVSFDRAAICLADVKRAAHWETMVRYGRSQKITYVVQGWEYAPGKLWPINRLVPLRDELIGLDGDRLIATAQFTLDESGFRTTLALVPPEAYDLVPIPTDQQVWDSL